jgi:diguanylate cyclase (GGDEF)-like protein
MGLLFVDLDSFKQVNDLLGHAVGDAVLAQVAQRIERCLRQRDTVARLGGDEFVVILTGSGEVALIEQTAQRVLDSLAEPFRLESETAHVSASIGIALYPVHAVLPEILLRHADQAMYRAKAAGRNQLRFFEPAMHGAAIAA